MDQQQIRQKLEAAVGGRERFAGSFAARTMRDLDKRAELELEGAAQIAASSIAGVDQALEREGLQAHSQFDPAAFVARFVRLWSAYQAAGARTMNWMVTGPARFPVARNRKRMDAEHNRYLELRAFYSGAPAVEIRKAKRARAEALGPAGLALGELEDLRARLAKREQRQAMMKAANAAVRKYGKLPRDEAMPAIERALEAAGRPEAKVLVSALGKAGMLQQGFERWETANNAAEIRRLKDRIAAVELKAARIEQAPDEPAERELGGIRLVRNAAIDRVQLIFPGKPAEAERTLLKRNAFRWSPREGAWQRQLTSNGVRAAEAVLAQLAA